MKEILELLVKGIVQTEDQVVIKETFGLVLHGKQTIDYSIKVRHEEFSLLVGREGSTIKALRMIMSKLAGKQKKIAYVNLDERGE